MLVHKSQPRGTVMLLLDCATRTCNLNILRKAAASFKGKDNSIKFEQYVYSFASLTLYKK